MKTSSVLILTLAYSRKNKGRCFAGKKVKIDSGKLKIQAWCRPVADSIESSEPILSEHIYGANDNHKGDEPEYFEIWEVPIKSHVNNRNKKLENNKVIQSENILIDESKKWTRIKNASDGQMLVKDNDKILDNPENLWGDKAEKIELSTLSEKITKTLYFIKPEFKDSVPELYITEGKIKLEFNYNNDLYKLSVTDPLTESLWLRYKKEDPVSAKSKLQSFIKGSYFTISLGEKYHGHHYKLIAAIIK